MLAANTCAADFMTRSKHEGLFRVHEGPTVEKLQNLRLFLKTLGLHLEGGDDPQAEHYGKLLRQISGRPDAGLIQTMCLRSMQQAIYSPDNSGHFGLAYPAYSHFTSPIRRYPDLLTHRVIKALLQRKRYTPQMAGEVAPVAGRGAKEQEHALWEELGLLCSARERRADDASRDVEAWLKCWFVKERVGESFSGTVTGVTSFGIFVTLDDLYVEGLVHISELGSEYFQFNEGLHELRGERTGMRYRLTDKVQVQVARVDLEARRIEFRLEKGVSYDSLRRAASRSEGGESAAADSPGAKRTKPDEGALLKGLPAKARRAVASKATQQAKEARKSKSAGTKRGRG